MPQPVRQPRTTASRTSVGSRSAATANPPATPPSFRSCRDRSTWNEPAQPPGPEPDPDEGGGGGGGIRSPPPGPASEGMPSPGSSGPASGGMLWAPPSAGPG